jgi:hypothetical protein
MPNAGPNRWVPTADIYNYSLSLLPRREISGATLPLRGIADGRRSSCSRVRPQDHEAHVITGKISVDIQSAMAGTPRLATPDALVGLLEKQIERRGWCFHECWDEIGVLGREAPEGIEQGVGARISWTDARPPS